MVFELFFPHAKAITLNLIQNFGTEIVAALIGGSIIWLMSLLPSQYQLQKRLNFAVKVSKVHSKIEISVKIQNLQSAKEIRDHIKDFIKKTNITSPLLQELTFSFKSVDTGITYELSPSEDEVSGTYFVSIKCSNIFNVGLFGKVRKLDESVDEISYLVENFNFKRDKDLISVHINVVSRLNFLKSETTKTTYTEKNCTAIYTHKNIKLVNKGSAYLSRNVKTVFYEWLNSSL